MTDKPDIKQLPQPKKKDKETIKKERSQKNITGTEIYPHLTSGARPPKMPTPVEDTRQYFGHKQIGPTYSMLRPEVKQTLEKIVY